MPDELIDKIMDDKNQSYQVLARKYRPSNFDELIGQEALVRTLTNAIENQKIAHAFILTGIRGIGKTTTARIIAKALNCTGEDGKSEIARKPCGTCSNCIAISNSRHQDVIEIDAASKTGVDDIRAIIDSILYSPAIGRYKIYIIDEVHMLSNSAFNALLKTLEEPPAHIKFIFATTEIRKVPITVLSRCQRFDLRRLKSEELAVHLKNVLQKEGFEAEEEALDLIATAADGSVRDLLSVADRVLSHNNFPKVLTGNSSYQVLGLSDKNKIIDLFTEILKGDAKAALSCLDKFYEISTDILSLIIDLQKITHQASLVKAISDYKMINFSSTQQEKIRELATKTSLADLARIWQMLIKGTSEIGNSLNQKMMMEMLLIRMCHLAEIPKLEQIIAQVNSSEASTTEKVNNDTVGDIMRNFPGAKIASNTKSNI
jgi:DNA polymerase-3 subunit gamma/tau